MPLYTAQSGDLDTDALRTDSQTLKDRGTQLLVKYKSGALVTQFDDFTPPKKTRDLLASRQKRISPPVKCAPSISCVPPVMTAVTLRIMGRAQHLFR